MSAALEEAKKAAIRDEVPVGAVLVENETGEIVVRDGNRTRQYADPTAHAEVLVIRKQCKALGVQRLPSYDLYVTLEPCTLCAAAISFARIRRVVFGALDQKGGGILHGAKFYERCTCHHRPEIIYGLYAADCGRILKEFFRDKR